MKKVKVFRSGGHLHLLEDVMFPGYIFIKTAFPKELSKELQKAKRFPQFIGDIKNVITPLEDKDLCFLQDVCGDNLQKIMGITNIKLNEKNRIVEAEGILNHYLDKVVKMNLHKRVAVVEIELFNRTQAVLFGLKLEQDQAV